MTVFSVPFSHFVFDCLPKRACCSHHFYLSECKLEAFFARHRSASWINSIVSQTDFITLQQSILHILKWSCESHCIVSYSAELMFAGFMLFHLVYLLKTLNDFFFLTPRSHKPKASRGFPPHSSQHKAYIHARCVSSPLFNFHMEHFSFCSSHLFACQTFCVSPLTELYLSGISNQFLLTSQLEVSG